MQHCTSILAIGEEGVEGWEEEEDDGRVRREVDEDASGFFGEGEGSLGFGGLERDWCFRAGRKERS